MKMNNNGTGDELENFEMLSDDTLYTTMNDDRQAELNGMIGLQPLEVKLWETSLGDEDDAPPVKPEERVFFDCDLMLEDGQVLELYVTTAYPDPDGEPVTGMDAISDAISAIANDSLEFLDYDQADEEGGLALAFGKDDDVKMVLVASAWAVSEWETEAEEAEGNDEDEE
jgi:hypothetical protein